MAIYRKDDCWVPSYSVLMLCETSSKRNFTYKVPCSTVITVKVWKELSRSLTAAAVLAQVMTRSTSAWNLHLKSLSVSVPEVLFNEAILSCDICPVFLWTNSFCFLFYYYCYTPVSVVVGFGYGVR